MPDWLLYTLGVCGVVSALFFLTVWLPFQIEMVRIGRRYGWPAAKREAIQKLFLDGSITSVGYMGAALRSYQDFMLIIVGPFGQHVRRGKGSKLYPLPNTAELPPQVADAFAGYIETCQGTVWLLWHLPFLKQLAQASDNKVRYDGKMPESLLILNTGMPLIA